MDGNNAIAGKKFAVLGLASLLALAVLVPMATGDSIIQGNIGLSFTIVPPEIVVNETTNHTNYLSSTFVVTTSIVDNVTYTTVQVHLNFNHNNSSKFTTLLLNILQVFNTGNATGHFTVTVNQSAQAGSYKNLNSSYTDALKIYMSHQWQTASLISGGGATQLANNTTTMFSFYPLTGQTPVEPMYYIGFNYTQPPYMPPGGQTWNKLQQFVNLTFTVVS